MKNHSPQITFAFIISVAILLLCLSSCKQSENNAGKTRLYIPQKIEENGEPALLSTSSSEIKSVKKKNNAEQIHYKNIVIPGNTMSSADCFPGKENNISVDGASLNVPAGSLKRTRKLSVIGLHTENLPSISDEIINVTGDSYAGYRFLPHGMLFDSAVTISMAYDSSLIPEGFTTDDIYTFYFNESENKWKPLDRKGIDIRSGMILSGTLHFTDMINGIIMIPESPETNGFVPTTIKDFKAADPDAGITLIDPPSANNEGDAELSYPLKLPPGRAGMQPQLILRYSSDVTNAWTGYGWGLDIHGISVDLNWGVPRYLHDKESETYLFAGSQLTPVAHRGDYVDRTPEKRFYARIEGSFSKIIRHGNNPGNYWWEVTTKEGVRNFYGGLPGTGVVLNAVSHDAAGNIGYWALMKTMDLHGNFVSYAYAKPEGCGQQIYISEITYTGHDTEEGPYKVTFLRTDDDNTFQRKDARINARYGFIQRDRELLRRINITISNEPVRSYTFKYKEGVFLKTLLESLTELDASGNEFYTYRFNYYDDVQVSDPVPFNEEKNWTLPNDGLKSPYLNIFLDDVSVLGASGSAGGSGSFATTIGLFDGKPYSKSFTAGGFVTYMNTTSEGFMTLTDINGDGIPDKVFKTDDGVYYRPNLLSWPSDEMFGEKKLIAGINEFSESKLSGFGGGAEAHPVIGFLGYNRINSKTKTTIYFEDFNADGLVDLADNGIVYFNHINENGDPEFTVSSELTPNPIRARSQIDMSMLPDPAEEQALLEAQFPLHDAVRMFQAPYSGVIKIIAPVSLTEDTSSVARRDTLKDGVIVSIQHKGNVLWSNESGADDHSVKIPFTGSIAINRGDRIYFRVQSKFNGSYDLVNWDPEILYETINGSDTLVNLKDSNGKKNGRFKASEDFILCGQQFVGMPKTGAVRIRSAFSKMETSDSIKVVIACTDTLGVVTNIFYHEYDCSTNIQNDSINLDLDVLKNEYVSFRVLSTTSVDWSSIKWNTRVEYTRIDDGTPVTMNGKPLLSFKAVPEFSTMFNNTVKNELPVIADTSFMLSAGLDTVDNVLHTVGITPSLLFNRSGNDTVVLSVKSNNKISGRKKYYFNGNGLISRDTLFAGVKLGDTLYFDYHLSDYSLAQSNALAEVVVGADTLNPYKASVLSSINNDDAIFGPLYRGWGYFDYNGNAERASAPIDESQLRLSDAYNANVSAMQDTSQLNGVQNPQSNVFNLMIPYAEKGSFMGTDEQVFILPEYMSSSRLGEKNVYVEPVVIPATGLNALAKESQNTSNSAAVGASPGFVSFSGSYSWEEGNLTIDMMDMNGDRYPDLLVKDKIQYTDVRGVLSGDALIHSLGDHYSKSEAYGFTLGGNYVHAKSDNSGTAAPAKSVKGNIGNNSKTNKNANSAQETSKSSIGMSGNFSTNNDHAEQTWLDINGDGLPDKIYNNGTVWLNLGYSFAPAEQWNFDAICTGGSIDYGGGLGVNIGNGSIVAGVGISKTDSEAENTFMDINADGLPDMVKGITVQFNTGNGFAASVEWPGLGALNKGESVGQSANAGFTIGITIPILPVLKLCVNPAGSASSGVSHTLTQVADIDGDGMPDFLSSDKENEMKVKSSRIFRTNLLKRVENPLGGNFEIDYLLTPAIYTHPGGKMAMKSVKVFDGLTGDGIDTTYNSFEYEDGFYGRRERVFYGFSSVKTHFHNTVDHNKIYRSVEQKYSNRNFYTKGNLLAETLTDAEGRKQLGTQNTYSFHNIHTGHTLPAIVAESDSMPVFVSLDETKDYAFRGASEPLITTRVTYSYDTFGNVSEYTDHSSGNEHDKYSVAVQYHHNTGSYIHSVPSRQEVMTFEGIRRKSETDISEYGDITQIRRFVTSDHAGKYDMQYDEYGNLVKITRPANYRGERLWHEYDYDDVLHSCITEVRDAYGYKSSSVYDYKWGAPVEVTDRNNQKIKYSFDDCGRVTTINGPYQLASGKPYTLAFEYHPDAGVPYAHTLHYDSIYDSAIETYSFSDGLGRQVQVKKTAMLFRDPSSEDAQGFIVSGTVLYDAFGRITKTYQQIFETASTPAIYNTTLDNIQPASAEYDVLDRIIKVTLPDGSVTSRRYNIGDYHGERMYLDSLTDALNNITVKYTRPNNRQQAIVKKTSSVEISTEYDYNGIGELLTVTDPLGNETRSVYNMTGNRISDNHPDAGLTEFVYDDAGNLIKKITADLRKKIPDGGAINYKYDYERLTEIVYPRNIQNRVNYTYGGPGEPYNRAGRIVLIQDASGGQEFFYDKLGQIIRTIRTVQIGESDMRTWIWSATYDTWNRVHTMIYPDGEKVTYKYDRAGNLQKMDGEKLGRSYSYISRIGYNKYEKQLYIKYGNGSETTFNYEPERQRLDQLKVSSNAMLLMNNTYTYDAMSNILDVTGHAGATGDIGGSASYQFSYDELYRLKQSAGRLTGSKDINAYSLDLQYDIMGKILQKTQVHNRNSKKMDATSYDFGYKYEGPKPSAPTEIGSRIFTYDENGNQTNWQDTITQDFRQLSWDEENRLVLISDNGYLNRYVYDAEGNRTIKSHGGSQGVYINGAPVGIINHSSNNYTVYVNPYFVFREGRFTKHYYNGSTRISSKTGTGQFLNQFRPGVFEITAGKVNYINRQQKLIAAKVDYEKQSGISPGPPTIKGIYADPDFSGTGYPDPGIPGNTAPPGWPKKPVFAEAGGPPGAPIQWGDDITNETVEAGFGFSGTGNYEEFLRYFYHNDHLGSASVITDYKGDVSQFIAYLPFGEIFAEKHTGWDSPYKFNAMEMDNETGLYNFGSGYYDPKTSMWLGVNPLTEKSPSLSPYIFAGNNPVFNKMNAADELSAFAEIHQSSARKSTRLYMPSTLSIPASISNIASLIKGPDFQEMEAPERSVENDPVKKKIKDRKEKMLAKLAQEKKEVKPAEDKAEEIHEAADKVKKAILPGEKPEEMKVADENAVKITVGKGFVISEEEVKQTGIKIESAKVPEKIIKHENNEKKE